jgi:alpha/beta superfamily hydrolase
MDNKVVHTIARAALATGWRSVRFNFRGVGASTGAWDCGVGEVEDALAVLQAHHRPDEPLVLAGFSFGAFVASQAAQRAAGLTLPLRAVQLVAPATENFTVASPVEGLLTTVIHGDADEVVPLAATLAWARATIQPVCVFPGVGHFFHGQLPRLRAVLEQALRSVAN